METLKNQTIYRCEYCNKRFLTKQGVKKHEEQFCYKSQIPKQKRLEKIMSCNHEWDTEYRYIPGEAVMEPNYDFCWKCGVRDTEWWELKKEGAPNV